MAPSRRSGFTRLLGAVAVVAAPVLVLSSAAPAWAGFAGRVDHPSPPHSFAAPNRQVETPISIGTYYQMAVDEAHQHVFVSGGDGVGYVVVMNFDGTQATTISGFQAVSGMAVDAANHLLYAADPTAGAIGVVDTETLTLVDTIPIPNLCPQDVALAGGRLWLTSYRSFGDCGGNQHLASMDLTTHVVTVDAQQGPGSYPWYLTTDPQDASLLLFCQQYPAIVSKYDATAATPTLLASYHGVGPEGCNDFTVTPDGQDVIVAGIAGSVGTLSLSNMAPVDGTYPPEGASGAIAVTPDGTKVASGSTSGAADAVRIFPRGGGDPSPVFGIGSPANGDDILGRGIAFSGAGDKLFVITIEWGAWPTTFAFTVLSDPTVADSALTISASPPTIPPYGTVTISGTLSFQDGASPQGAVIVFQDGGGTTLDAVVGADGTWSTTSTPTTPGTFTWEAVFRGDDVHSGVAAFVTVPVYGPDAQPGTLTISVSRPTVPFLGAVTVTARLVDPLASPNRQVTITKSPVGVAQSHVTGTIDANGRFSYTFHLTRTSSFFASWSGDPTHVYTLSGSKKVTAGSLTQEALKGGYATVSGYRLYHYSSQCPQTHQDGCIHVGVTVQPSNWGGQVCFTLQQYEGGSWTATQTACGALDSNSQQILTIYYDGPGIIGQRGRVRARFSGSASNLASASGWHYLKVTS